MGNDKKEDRELRDAVRILLKTTEDLKSTVAPLCQGQEHVLQSLKKHEEAIGSLMDKLIGTREDHVSTLERLELVESNASRLAESQESLKQLESVLEERLKKLEFGQIIPIVEKIRKSIPPSAEDLKTIDSLLSSYPDDEILLSIKAEALDKSGRSEEALELLEDAIQRKPNNPRLWYEKGLFLSDFDEALKSFDKSLEQLKDGPRIPQHLVLFARASLLAEAGKFEDALDSSTKSVEMNPDCSGGWSQKGSILFKLGRIPEALGCYEKAIELDPTSKEVWFQKGRALSALGPTYTPEALSSYDKAIGIDATWAPPYFDKGKVLLKACQYEKALQSFETGLEFDDKKACVWCDRGVTLNRLKRNEEALQSFRRAMELGPPKRCTLIFLDVAIVLYHLGRYDEGGDFAKRAVEAEPHNAKYLSALACYLLRLDKENEALETFEKALKFRKDDKEIDWDDLAELYDRMGRGKDAEEARQKFKSIEALRINETDNEQAH